MAKPYVSAIESFLADAQLLRSEYLLMHRVATQSAAGLLPESDRTLAKLVDGLHKKYDKRVEGLAKKYGEPLAATPEGMYLDAIRAEVQAEGHRNNFNGIGESFLRNGLQFLAEIARIRKLDRDLVQTNLTAVSHELAQRLVKGELFKILGSYSNRLSYTPEVAYAQALHDAYSDDGKKRLPRDPARIAQDLDRDVEELELSVRAYNCLKNANMRTIRDLVIKTEAEMLKIKNFGRHSLIELQGILRPMGLYFGMKPDELP